MFEYMQMIQGLSLRDLRTYCALFTRDAAMRYWNRSQCISYIRAWKELAS